METANDVIIVDGLSFAWSLTAHRTLAITLHRFIVQIEKKSMELALIATVVTIIGTTIIAMNNFFGLKDRAVKYLREKLKVTTLEEEIARRHVESDRNLLNQIRETLPSDYPIIKLRDYDFGGVYSDELTEGMHEFLHGCRKPEFEFHDPDLEEAREELEEAVRRFTRTSGKETFYLEGSTEKRRIPSEWHHKQPKRWHRVRNELNGAADDIVEAYDKLVRTGRKKLGG